MCIRCVSVARDANDNISSCVLEREDRKTVNMPADKVKKLLKAGENIENLALISEDKLVLIDKVNIEGQPSDSKSMLFMTFEAYAEICSGYRLIALSANKIQRPNSEVCDYVLDRVLDKATKIDLSKLSGDDSIVSVPYKNFDYISSCSSNPVVKAFEVGQHNKDYSLSLSFSYSVGDVIKPSIESALHEIGLSDFQLKNRASLGGRYRIEFNENKDNEHACCVTIYVNKKKGYLEIGVFLTKGDDAYNGIRAIYETHYYDIRPLIPIEEHETAGYGVGGIKIIPDIIRNFIKANKDGIHKAINSDDIYAHLDDFEELSEEQYIKLVNRGTPIYFAQGNVPKFVKTTDFSKIRYNVSWGYTMGFRRVLDINGDVYIWFGKDTEESLWC